MEIQDLRRLKKEAKRKRLPEELLKWTPYKLFVDKFIFISFYLTSYLLIFYNNKSYLVFIWFKNKFIALSDFKIKSLDRLLT